MKRFALAVIIVCWLLVLLVPALRQMFLVQVMGRSVLYRGWAYGPVGGNSWSFSPAKIKDRFPYNPQVQASAVEEQSDYKDDGARRLLRDYDALIERFPGETWLIARRIKRTIKWMKPTRIGGEMSDPDVAKNKAAGIPSPERPKEPPNFTPQERKAVIALARLGQQREPNNAFFDWMLFYLLMMEWRDDEAWRVLARASHKPDYNDHTRERLHAKIAASELEVERPLLWEEKLTVFSGLFTYEINAKEREMARIVAWESLKAGRRRGNHRKALQISSDFARLQALRASRSYTVIEHLVANAMMAVALGIEGKALRTDMTPQQWQSAEYRARVRARKWGRYAIKHGRPDLAREIGRLCIENGRHQEIITTQILNQNQGRNSYYMGMAARPLVWSIALWWAASLLLLLLPMFGIWWLLLGGALKIAHVPDAPVTPRSIFWPVFVTTIFTALCWSLALRLGAGSNWLSIPIGLTLPDWMILGAYVPLVIGLIMPGLLATFVCWWATRREPDAPRLGFHLRWRERLRGIRLAELIFSAALGGSIAATAYFWILCLGSGFYGYLSHVADVFGQLPTVLPLWGQIGFTLGVFAIWLRWILWTPLYKKPLLALRLRRIRATMGALVAVGSVAYLLLLAASLPVRQAADAQFDDMLQRGEVAVMLQNSSSR